MSLDKYLLLFLISFCSLVTSASLRNAQFTGREMIVSHQLEALLQPVERGVESIPHVLVYKEIDVPFVTKNDRSPVGRIHPWEQIKVQKPWRNSPFWVTEIYLGTLSEGQFNYLKKTFGFGLSNLKFNPDHNYKLQEFLPAAMQALTNRQFVSEVQLSKKLYKGEVYDQSPVLYTNCYSTMMSLLMYLYGQQPNEFTMFNIDWKSGTDFFHHKKLFREINSTIGGRRRALDSLYEPNLQAWDLIAFESKSSSKLIFHTQMVVAVNHSENREERGYLVYEKVGPQSFHPYRLRYISWDEMVASLSGRYNYHVLRVNSQINVQKNVNQFIRENGRSLLVSRKVNDKEPVNTLVYKVKHQPSGLAWLSRQESNWNYLWDDVNMKIAGPTPSTCNSLMLNKTY